MRLSEYEHVSASVKEASAKGGPSLAAIKNRRHRPSAAGSSGAPKRADLEPEQPQPYPPRRPKAKPTAGIFAKMAAFSKPANASGHEAKGAKVPLARGAKLHVGWLERELTQPGAMQPPASS